MRLFIFLAIFLSFAASELAADETIVVSGWVVAKIDNAFSDGQRLIAGKAINENEGLTLSCINNTEIISFFPGDLVEEGRSFLVKVRIDNGDITDMAFLSDARGGKRIFMNDVPSGFFYKLRDASKISFRIPESAGHFDVSYPLSGINDVLPYLEKACPYAPRE